ncbi:trypsin-like peptidase domain-containing protein [Streptomyces kaniharaensis]|uniref:Trypsin-like peptidase domain-containing protein n=1 Tax=Streptomyces kaniharaensis TaxID=212423 RepID=A0A6N7KT89_9ACTN|nr:trypsin-like peptidase domain-containing protein [Streptomyces kaniharaensis]MQS14015.1 trypsin-like peptidase domain-containing protein [Streptomyces kaniharaensis]
MGQHRRPTPRRRLLAPTLFTAFSAVTVAAVVTGMHSLSPSEATAASSPSRASPTASASPPAASPPAAVPSAAPVSTSPVVPSAQSSSPPSTEDATPSPTPTATPSTPSTAPSATATAPVTPESVTVGVLFTGSVPAGNHFCTASVVHSPTRNLLLTAAHCLNTTDTVTFAPGYRDGRTPFGTWQVTAIHTTTGWSQRADQDEDFAFLETAPSNGRKVEDVVGGNRLGVDEPFDATIRLYGYAADSESPNLCTNTSGRQSSYQRVISCPGYPAGTSGGPWINTATGDVVGAIGGYQQGGETDDVSYSAYFDHTIAALFSQTEAAAS